MDGSEDEWINIEADECMNTQIRNWQMGSGLMDGCLNNGLTGEQPYEKVKEEWRPSEWTDL